MRSRISLEDISKGQLRYNEYRKLFQKDLKRCQLGDTGPALIMAKYSFEDKERPLLVIGLSNKWKKFIKAELAAGNKALALGKFELRQKGQQSVLFLEKSKGKIPEAVLEKLFKRYTLSREYRISFEDAEEVLAKPNDEKSPLLEKLEAAIRRFRALPKTAIRKRYKLGRAIALLNQQWLQQEAKNYSHSVQQRLVETGQNIKQALKVYQELIERKRAQS